MRNSLIRPGAIGLDSRSLANCADVSGRGCCSLFDLMMTKPCIERVSLVSGGKEQPFRLGKVGAGIGPIVEIRQSQCVLQFLGGPGLGLRRQSRF